MKWKIGWGVTRLCNMRCSFCYSQDARDRAKEQSLDDMLRFLDANHRYIESINYGTGENTLRDNWYDLVKHVHKHHPYIRQALTTNGYLASALRERPDADEIIAALDEVDVSLDYADESMHTESRRHPEAFRWAIETIGLCTMNNIITSIVCVGINSTMNRPNLEGLFELAGQLGCYVRLNIYRPVVNNDLNCLDYDLLKQAMLYVLENHNIVSLCDPLFSSLVLRQRSVDATGVTSLRILPNGAITPSTYLVTDQWKSDHIISGNLGTERFKVKMVQGFDIKTNRIPDDCRSCRIGHLCRGGAIDRRMIWYDTCNTRDPYCPYRHDGDLNVWSSIAARLIPLEGPSCHDGYLPTLIFQPRGTSQ